MWSCAKALQIPIDKRIEEIRHVPYTISFVMRKRMQIDSFNELPSEKRPPEKLVWEGTSEDIDKWLDEVFERQGTKKGNGIDLLISDEEIET